MRVHILTTVRREELLPASTLVFPSLRTGFPTADVTVHLAGWEQNAMWDEVMKACNAAGVNHTTVRNPGENPHYAPAWIEELLATETEPLIICDPDIVFWKTIEDWSFGDALMAGRFIPQFRDRFTNCITRPRLHTSLLYLNPARIREEIEKYFAQFPVTPFNPRPNLLHPMFHPIRIADGVRNYFYDLCALLYHAIGGQSFTHDQLENFDHLGFGSISDLVVPHYPGYDLRMKAFVVFDNPKLLKGQWRVEDQFYADNAA